MKNFKIFILSTITLYWTAPPFINGLLPAVLVIRGGIPKKKKYSIQYKILSVKPHTERNFVLTDDNSYP